VAKKGKYDWSTPPPVDSHTKVKHGIIHDYIKEYLLTLAKPRHATELKLSIFDCFCGGGLYLDLDGLNEHLGSPLQILSAVNNTEIEIQCQDRPYNYNVNAQYVFSDDDESAIRALKSNLTNKGYVNIIGNCKVAKFADIVDELIASAKLQSPRSERALFILDQYGYTDARANEIVKIFNELKNPEVLLFLSTGKISDFLNKSMGFRAGLNNADILLPVDKLLRIRGQSRMLAEYQHECRKEILNSFQAQLGPIFMHPFSIKSSTDNREYWFAHITRHWTAREVMLGIHRRYANQSVLYGPNGLDLAMFGYAEDNDYSPHLIEESTVAVLDKNLPEHLMENLSRFLRNNDLYGITVEELMLRTANGNPGDKDIMARVYQMMMDNDITFHSARGGSRQKGTAIELTDIIKHTGQKRFSL